MSDFEFKPLTEGLGFHKKTKQTNTKPPEGLFKQPLPQGLDVIEPLPRKGQVKPSFSPIPQATRTVDNILQTLQTQTRQSLDLFPNAANVYQPSAWQPSAGILDSMLILSSCLLGLIVLLLFTHVDLFAILTTPNPDPMVFISLIAMVAGFSWIYLVGNRLFLGFTPGEWVFDQRLSTPDQVGSATYSMKVALRSTLVILTGFVIFPALSLLTGKDILGQLVGAELQKKVA